MYNNYDVIKIKVTGGCNMYSSTLFTIISTCICGLVVIFCIVFLIIEIIEVIKK
jgi:hypothetical protein